jgi:hypothetical protein
MATFQVGKTYYYISIYVRKIEVVKKTKCFIWVKSNNSDIEKRKIKYTDNNEEYIIYFRKRNLYSSCRWCRYWKIEKNEEGYEIIIKPDYKEFYKMNTATLKMFKYITNTWAKGRLSYYENGIIDYEYLVKEMVEDNPDDYDKDYYCLYYTSNKDINWDMINILMCRNYRIIQKY